MTSSEPRVEAPFLEMSGARVAASRGLSHIERQIEAIETAIEHQPALVFDLARTLVESTCRRVLEDKQIDYRNSDDLPSLFKTVISNLQLLPSHATADVEARKSLAKTTKGLSNAVQGLCELRNHCGFASHGSGDAKPAMGMLQAKLSAQTADLLVGFIYGAHVEARKMDGAKVVRFGERADFDQHVDDLYALVEIFDCQYRASEILFNVDPQAYNDALANFTNAGEDE